MRLENYISFAPGGYDASSTEHLAEFHDWWPATIVIGKDILIPAHGIYWMIMLHALGFPDEAMPKFLVHGFWNISGAKISKSLGNVVDPELVAEKYGAEALRYYLMSDVATGSDSDFSEERLLSRYNTDLANSLGNLLNRSLSMTSKYRDGRLGRGFEADPLFLTPDDGRALLIGHLGWVSGMAKVEQDSFSNSLTQFAIHDIIGRLLHWSGLSNALVEIAAPWKMHKDQRRKSDLDAVLYHLAESLRIIAILISPVLPKAAHGIFDQLNWKMESTGKEERFSLAEAEWGMLPDGHLVGQPTPIFPRIETAAKTV